MALIVVDVPNIDGACSIANYADKIEAVAVRETIEVGVPGSAGSGGASGGGLGRAKHSDIELTRYKDRASPKLAQACSAGTNLGDVKILLFRALETGTVPYMSYLLSATYVSRIEHDTLDEESIAFQPHLYATTRGAPVAGQVGLGTILAPVVGSHAATTRMLPQPILGPRGAPSNREVERVWLSAARVEWEYTSYLNGVKQDSIAKFYNIAEATGG